MLLSSKSLSGVKSIELEVFPSKDCLYEAVANNGKCEPRKCWHYVAINMLMDRFEPNTQHYVRVDGGHVKLVYRGWRYIANTPQHVKRSLMLFDAKRYEEVYVKEYRLCFQRTTKVAVLSKERKAQLLDAQRARRRLQRKMILAESIPGGKRKHKAPKTLRQRVEGFSGIV